MQNRLKWCNDEISKPDVISGNIFPSCRLFVGTELDVALCRHADPVMNPSALHYDSFRRLHALFPERAPPLHHSSASAADNTAACAALVIPRTLWRSRLFPDPLFFLLCCHTFLCLLCLTDWTSATVELWLPAHINSVKFQGCLCLFKSKESLKWRQKVQMWN